MIGAEHFPSRVEYFFIEFTSDRKIAKSRIHDCEMVYGGQGVRVLTTEHALTTTQGPLLEITSGDEITHVAKHCS